MLYIIKSFEFDSTNLLLTKNGEPIDIRHNEAKLLSLLLEQPAKVLSKEDILSHVWKDKVVSEQAVFQNISHLRSLFGSDAIKTFSKRGYQWQLTNQSGEQATHKIKTKVNMYWLTAVLISLVFIVISVIVFQPDSSANVTAPRIKLAYIPFKQAPNTASVTFKDNNYFDFSPLNDVDIATFSVSAVKYQYLAKIHPLVMTGELRKHKQNFYLDFTIKGPLGDWQGQLSGVDQDSLLIQLQHHLQQTFIYDLLSQPQALELKQAKLSIAHQQAPSDLINLGKLINVYIEMEAFEKAMVMANKLEKMANPLENPQQLGNALLYQSNILTRKGLYELSASKLTAAIAQFEQIGDLKHQADAWYAQSWLDHQQQDYTAIKKSLLKSAKLSLDATDIMRELDALIYLSVMAHKHRQETDKYQYLQQAENKMTLYQLASYHFARVPFHYAIFAKNPADKEPHYKQVLQFTALIPDHWVAQESRKQLLKHYIAKNRLEEAQVLINNLTTDTPNNTYLQTLLAQANNQDDIVNRLAQRAFEQAQLAGDRRLSLDIALLLCSDTKTQVNYDFYSQYIDEKATKSWRSDNKAVLLALNL
jgi:DNA-binding winged helix-turn-helix (wHTH) protein